MNTENVVLEWWSHGGTRNGVSESLNNDSRHHVGGVAAEKAVLEGGWRRVLAKNGCAQLPACTALYRLVPLFLDITLQTGFEAGKSARFAGFGVTKSWLWIQGAAFCRLLPPSATFSHGGVEVECEIGGKDLLAEAYFRFGKRGNKLVNWSYVTG